MTKTFTIGTVITSMWQSKVIALLILISLIFLADLYSQYTESKKITCTPSPDLTVWSYGDVNTEDLTEEEQLEFISDNLWEPMENELPELVRGAIESAAQVTYNFIEDLDK